MLETFVTYKFYEICIKSISEFKVNTITMYFLYSANVFHIQYLYYLSYMYIYNLSNLTQVSADRRLFKKIFYIHFFSYINFIHDFFTNYTFSLSHYPNIPSLYLFYSLVFIKSREIFFSRRHDKLFHLVTMVRFLLLTRSGFFRSLSFHISL